MLTEKVMKMPEGASDERVYHTPDLSVRPDHAILEGAFNLVVCRTPNPALL
jgi:hypothetical protein